MKKVYVDHIIEGLKDLASYDFQKTAWFENEYNLCSSFNDDVEGIFEHNGLEVAFDESEIVFGKKADAALRDLEKACNALGYNWAGKEKVLLESEEMAIIRAMAKGCLRLIKNYNGSETTVELIDSGASRPKISFPDRDIL